MSEKRFEAERYPYAYGGGTWAIYDNQATHGRTVYREFAYDYVGGPQAAAEAEAARLNAWWEAKKAWRVPVEHGGRWIVDSSGLLRIRCYPAKIKGGGDATLAERICRLLNEDDARREGRGGK